MNFEGLNSIITRSSYRAIVLKTLFYIFSMPFKLEKSRETLFRYLAFGNSLRNLHVLHHAC